MDESYTIPVPLTYDEIANLIEALQWEMGRTQDADFRQLIAKLKIYQQLVRESR